MKPESFTGKTIATVVMLLALCFAACPSGAVTLNDCADRNPSASYECSYRPQVVPPWDIWIAGPVRATPNLLTEDAVKDVYASYLVANCPDCCDPGSVVSETGWVERVDVFRWGPDWPRWYDKTVTYSVTQRGSDGKCLTPNTFGATMAKARNVGCEHGWVKETIATDLTVCTRPQRNSECRFGHPIVLPAGTKVFTEIDYRSAILGGISFVRDYRGDGFSYPNTNFDNLWVGLGRSWIHNYDGTLYITPQSIWVTWGQNPPQYFALPGSSAYPVALTSIRKAQKVGLSQTSASTYVYRAANNDLVTFQQIDSVRAKPISVVTATGWGVSLSYGQYGVDSLTDSGGRIARLGYDDKMRVVSFTDPSSRQVRYEYKPSLPDGSNIKYDGLEYTSLSRVTYQDGKSLQYISPDLDYVGKLADYDVNRITGIIDELGVAYENVTYQPYGGPVKSSELAGGVDKYVLSGGRITDPLGSSRDYSYGGTQNAITGAWQPAGAGCAASNSSYAYDSASGNPASKTDFDGIRTCYAYDTAGRNVELARAEGLTQYSTCSAYTPANATLPTGSRKVSTTWHPDWRLQTKVAEPGRYTTNVYNGQPDPFNGNALASCAPSTALLPDGKPIAVLCKQVQQATTDVDGHLGFTAALQSGVANRVQQWTYNQYGQVLTAKDPLNNTTSYAYYTDTSFTGTDPNAVGHTIGDLQTMTNAKSQVTTYSQYDKHGNLLQMSDPNGVVTTNTYDLRQRLLSTSVGGQTTSYSYDPAGQLLKVTAPDASWLGYEYDPAHRMTATKDNLGNRIEYTLDNAGNRTAENVKDTSGALRRQLARSIDALGRTQQTTGRE